MWCVFFSASTARAAFSRALRQLEGVPDARDSALYLLASVRGGKTIPFANALLRSNTPLTPAQAAQLHALCARRAAREPLQYILREWDFAGLTDLAVRAPTLIPRPETEDLVALAVAAAQQLEGGGGGGGGTLLDVGTGSGAIAVAMLARLPTWRALAVDVSAEACALARENGARAGVAARLAVAQGDLHALAPRQRIDLVVSNPPYIPAADLPGLAPEVAQWEDCRALAGGAPRGLGLTLALMVRAGGGWGASASASAAAAAPLRPRTPMLLEVDAQHPALLHALLRAPGALVLHPASGLGQPRGLTPLEQAAATPLGAAEVAEAEGAAALAAGGGGSGPGALRALPEQWQWVRAYYSCGDLPRIVHLVKR